MELEYVFCGQMEAFLCSHLKGKVELLPSSFPVPFSVEEELPSSSLKVSLSPQDKIVLGSYGLHQLSLLSGTGNSLNQRALKETIELNWRAKGDTLRD